MFMDQLNDSSPTETDAVLAAASARRLEANLTNRSDTIELRVGDMDATADPIIIPTKAFQLFVRILTEMADGHAVRLMPHESELTTQQAADLLNVSRPYIVRLLDQGRIPSHKVGTHRRVLLKDAMAYKHAHHQARSAALDRLSALDQELGLT